MAAQRGFDGHRIRPPEVVRAILNGDTEQLKKLGSAGGKAAAEANRRRKAEETARKEEMETFLREECRKWNEENFFVTNQHLCPID